MGGRGANSGMGSIGGLTMQSSDITKGYANSTNARVINSALRRDQQLNPSNQEIVKRMDNAMETTKRDMTVYREFSLFDVEDVFEIQPKGNSFEDLRAAAVGTTFTDKGFMSTYHSPTGNQYGSAKMKIDAKAGTKAILSSNVKENEVILGRNQSWKVTDVTIENGDIVFYVTNRRR